MTHRLPADRRKNTPAGSKPAGAFADAFGGQAGEGSHHAGLILPVGDAVPFVVAVQHLDLRLAVLDQVGDDGGQEIFALEGVGRQVLGQESAEAGLRLLHEAGGQTPAAHADQGVPRQVYPGVAVGVADGSVRFLHDLGALGDAGQHPVAAHLADAAGDAAVFGHGVFHLVAHHAVLVFVAVGVGGQVIVNDLEGLGAVVVVRIDDRKGPVDQVPGAEHRLPGAERLGPPFRHSVGGGQIVQGLEGVLHLHQVGQPVPDHFPEGRLVLLADDEDDFFKAGAPGVKNGIVDDDLPAWAHRVELFHAAVAAAHPGSQYDQYGFFHSSVLLCLQGMFDKPIIAPWGGPWQYSFCCLFELCQGIGKELLALRAGFVYNRGIHGETRRCKTHFRQVKRFERSLENNGFR